MKNCIYLVFLFLLLGCNYQSNQKKHVQITHKTINIKNNYIGKAGPIIFANNKIIGIDFMLDTCFFYIDTEKGELCRLGIKGQGANDFLYPYTLQQLSDNTFGVYDLTAKKFSEINIKDSIKLEQRHYVSKDIMSFNFKKLSNNRYLGFGPYKNEMFIITDSLGIKINAFYEFPYKDNNEKATKNHLRSMAYQGTISTNISNNKFIYTPTFGDIIHLYKWENDSIKIICKIECSYPSYTIEEGGGGFGAPLNPNNIAGYISSAATDQYIYLLYSGTKLIDFIKEKKEFCGNTLFIYNWEGKKLKELKLDIECRYITISTDNKILWGIAYNPDPELVYFDLSKID